MKKKYFILIAIILLNAGSGYSADFYTEMPIDPFMSEFNPEYVDKNNFATGEFEMKKFIQNTFGNKKDKKNKKLNNKEVSVQDTDNNEPDEIESKNTNQPIIKEEIINLQKGDEVLSPEKTVEEKEKTTKQPKKHLTKAQLERELNNEEREKEREIQKQLKKEDKRTLIEKIFNIEKSPDESTKSKFSSSKDDGYVPPQNPNINISADFMEYFPDKYEIHAIGNAKVVFQAENTKIYGDKIVYDYDKNILKATDNVILVSEDSTTEGDFIKLDLSKPTGWLQNPSTKSTEIKIDAKEAYLYSDNITEYDGVARFLGDEVISLGARSFASYVDQSGLLDGSSGYNQLSDANKGIYKIKANVIVIDSKDEHEVITMKNAGVYLKNRKIATIPNIKIVSNKMHKNVETNFPEIGSQSQIGMHIGPAVVLNVPGGATLKLAPLLTYGNSDFGLGAMARLRTLNNVTQIGYGTSKKRLIVKGKHKLAPGLMLNYSKYANEPEWFLGYRMPKYSLALNYSRSDYVKDLGINFSQMYSAGFYVDMKDEYDLSNVHTRYRWMTQTFKPLYKYQNKESDVSLALGVVAQTVATVYSQGEALGLFRIGPSLSTRLGKWSQSIMYYQTASAGESPYDFDRYRYGKSNISLLEAYKVCDYLTVGYVASIAMNNPYHDDYHHDDLLQENRFMVAIGPEYAKITIGYDAIRHTTSMFFSMLIGTKDSDVEFKKTIIKNPNTLGVEKRKQKKPKRKSYKKYKKEFNPENEQLG